MGKARPGLLATFDMTLKSHPSSREPHGTGWDLSCSLPEPTVLIFSQEWLPVRGWPVGDEQAGNCRG